VPVYEEIPNKRFVFTFPEVAARYFRLVNTMSSNTLSPVEVTEMEGVGFILSEPRQSFTSTTERDFGGFRIYYRHSVKLSMGYSISYGHSIQDITDRESTSISQSANLKYILIPTYLTLSTGLSLSDSEGKDRLDSSDLNYNLTLSSRLLPTLGVSLGYRLSEAERGGMKTSETDALSANVTMKLYRGVDLGLRGSVSESTSFSQSPSVPQSGSQVVGFTGDLRLRPWNKLYISLSGSTSSSESDTEGVKTTTTSNSLNSNFSYNFSSALNVSGRFTIEPTSSQSFFVSWVPTKNIQTSVRLAFAEDTTSTGGSIDWRPLRKLSFSLGFSDTENDKTGVKSESLFLRGSFGF
jgi:hypothetical protein